MHHNVGPRVWVGTSLRPKLSCTVLYYVGSSSTLEKNGLSASPVYCDPVLSCPVCTAIKVNCAKVTNQERLSHYRVKYIQ